jgi:site-specific recombinase XerC
MSHRIFGGEEWGASAFASSSIPSCCFVYQYMNPKANSSSIQSSHQAHFKAVRVTRRSHKPSYGLTDAEITPELGQELAEFYRFMTEGDVKAPEVKPITAVTAKNYLIQARQCLGWMHRHHTPVVPLSQLRLSELFFPSGLRAEETFREKATRLQMANVEDYLQWLRLEREVAPSYELQVVKALVWVVKFLESVSTHQVLKRRSRRLPSRWEEAALKELRSLMRDIQAQGKTVQRVADEASKWIDWPEFLNCVKQLKAECTPISKSNQRRSKSAIATSIQRYLIFAFFSAIPERPRTVRELELGRTLVKRDEVWYLELGPEDFKTGETYSKLGVKRVLPIPQWYYPELEAWLFGCEDEEGVWQGYVDEKGNRCGWRQFFEPTHSFVFFQKNGKPFTSETFCGLFKQVAYRLTGKAFNPQLIRNIAIAHLMNSGASVEVMESLANLMGHSPQMQQKIYSRHAQTQHSTLALDALAAISSKVLE